MTRDQAEAKARELLGEDEVSVSYGEGHEGLGWYGWVADYACDGSVFLGHSEVG